MNESLSNCKVCKEQIKFGAKKCIHCDSYQDYRRYLTFSTVVLSLLVALISVLTVFIPVVKKAFTPIGSDTRFSLYANHNDKITIIASNLGNRNAVLKKAHILREEGGTKKNTNIEAVLQESDRIIEAGKVKFLNFRFAIEETNIPLPKCDPDTDNCKYFIDFDVIAFDHSPEQPKPILIK